MAGNHEDGLDSKSRGRGRPRQQSQNRSDTCAKKNLRSVSVRLAPRPGCKRMEVPFSYEFFCPVQWGMDNLLSAFRD